MKPRAMWFRTRSIIAIPGTRDTSAIAMTSPMPVRNPKSALIALVIGKLARAEPIPPLRPASALGHQGASGSRIEGQDPRAP